MDRNDIAQRRLAQQRLTGDPLSTPAEVVAWLGAVQAQDYAGAKWAIAQRTHGLTDAALDEAFNTGQILRTHLLRPTWHFVTPADIRWLLALTGPRVHATNQSRYRELDLSEATLDRSTSVLAQALRGGQQLTRNELANVLEGEGISTEGQRMAYMLMRAELAAIICSGPRRGKQFTYMLLEERVPPVPALDRETALAELTRRYFRARGPATVQDFAWWCWLTVADIRAGIEMLGSELARLEIKGRTYWYARDAAPTPLNDSVAHLLPNYDEYYIGYVDRSAIIIATAITEEEANVPHTFSHALLVDGFIAGAWRRELKRDRVLIEVRFGIEPTAAQRAAVVAAAERYGEFLGLHVALETSIHG